jgi:hypothetical protein
MTIRMIIFCWKLIKKIPFCESCFHFQEDSSALKYVLIGYYMKKLWVFEVLLIATPKAWVSSSKSMIYSNYTFIPLKAYFYRESHLNNFNFWLPKCQQEQCFWGSWSMIWIMLKECLHSISMKLNLNISLLMELTKSLHSMLLVYDSWPWWVPIMILCISSKVTTPKVGTCFLFCCWKWECKMFFQRVISKCKGNPMPLVS